MLARIGTPRTGQQRGSRPIMRRVTLTGRREGLLPVFITFEGPDGSGKTTQFRRVEGALNAMGYTVLTTREPGGTPIAEQIRDVLLNHPENTEMTPEAEFLLFSASRAQHTRRLIQPALDEGKLVLCDRFYDSSLAYQGYGHGLDLDTLMQITMFATGGLKPDITVFLDCPPSVGLARRQNQTKFDRLDAMPEDWHLRTYNGFKALIAAAPERWAVIDATRSIDNVFEQIMTALKRRGLG